MNHLSFEWMLENDWIIDTTSYNYGGERASDDAGEIFAA